MNPALLNYLQQMNQQQTEGMQQASPQQHSTGYNPYDAGIQKAIASARESLSMTDKQQNKAMRSALLAFGSQAAQQPRVKGFWNNLGQVLQAAGPAIATHDAEEDIALKENNALANQILAQQAAEQARQAQAEERAWHRQHAERQLAGTEEERAWHRGHAEAQLAETKRSHNLLDNFRREERERAMQERPLTKQELAEQEQAQSQQDLLNIINTAEQTINTAGKKGVRNRAERLANEWLPGGYRPNEEQASIDAIGDILRGKIFNHFKYRNETEFKHIPSISSENSPETNKRILQELKKTFRGEKSALQFPVPTNTMDTGQSEPLNNVSQEIPMIDPQGNAVWVNSEDAQEALNQGYQLDNNI